MDLKALIKKDTEIKVAYPDPELKGFELTVAYADKDAMKDVRKQCVTHVYNKKTRAMEESIDEDKFVSSYVGMILKGWVGFKYKYLAELLPVDLTSVDAEAELPYTLDNAVMLMQNSSVFEAVVGDMVADISAFSKA